MRFERDERGDVRPETVRMTIKEAKRWLYRPDRQVPPHLLMEVKRHRAAKEAAEHEAELNARFPERKVRGPSRLWQEMERRQPGISA